MLRTSSQRQAVRDGALRLRYRCIFATSFAAASLHLRCVFAASSLLIADVSLQSTRRSSMPFWSTSRRRASSARSASCCSREGVLSRRRDLPFLGNGRLRYEADYGTDGVPWFLTAEQRSRGSAATSLPRQAALDASRAPTSIAAYNCGRRIPRDAGLPRIASHSSCA